MRTEQGDDEDDEEDAKEEKTLRRAPKGESAKTLKPEDHPEDRTDALSTTRIGQAGPDRERS